MTKLKPFQKEGVRQIYKFRGRALLADDMGLGKTLQALYWLHKIPSRRPAVIVTPASVKYVWHSEAKLHLGMRCEVLEGNRKKHSRIYGDIIVLNYNILKSWLPLLLRLRPRVVIIDEAHYIKNLSAQRTRQTAKLCQYAESVIAISGTPLTNRPIELWPVLRIIRPDLFPSREEFAWRYCAPRWTFWGWRYDGATRLKELNKILRNECMIRRLKKDVLPELPPKIRQVVPFRLDSKAMREYREAERDLIKWLRKQGQTRRAKRAAKAKQLSKIGYLIRLTAELKLKWTVRWIEDFFEAHPGKKLVVLTMHTFVIDHLKQHFGKRVAVIDGRVVGRKREETVRQFRNNPRVDLCVGNWIAAGIGITLIAASNLAALDFPWTPGDMLQGEDRINRIGQKYKTFIHYLMALDTIEAKQMGILRKKSKILDAVLDGRRSSKDLDLFNELLTELKR